MILYFDTLVTSKLIIMLGKKKQIHNDGLVPDMRPFSWEDCGLNNIFSETATFPALRHYFKSPYAVSKLKTFGICLLLDQVSLTDMIASCMYK